jgi:hypothetical protein
MVILRQRRGSWRGWGKIMMIWRWKLEISMVARIMLEVSSLESTRNALSDSKYQIDLSNKHLWGFEGFELYSLLNNINEL